MKDVISQLCYYDEEMEFFKEKEKMGVETKIEAYEKLRSRLSEEDKKLLEQVYEDFQESHLDETSIYYRLGMKTGFALAQELL